MSDLSPLHSGNEDDSLLEQPSVPAKGGRPRRWIIGGIVILLLLVCGGSLLLLLPLADHARWVRADAEFKMDLKDIGIAAGEAGDIYGQLPPILYYEVGTEHFTSPTSFHMMLLPFFGESDLWKKIDTTVSWNAPANIPSYQTVIPGYLSPRFERRETSAGMGAAHLVPNSQLIDGGNGLAISDIRDGLSSTVMAGGIDDSAVPAWGDPDNGRDPVNGFGGGAKAFGGAANGGAQVVMVDGSVRLINPDIAPEVAKALASPAGGETVGEF